MRSLSLARKTAVLGCFLEKSIEDGGEYVSKPFR
jgi:hypothetical protein